MPRSRRRTNPFYVLLVAVGMAFTITACAYFVLALRGDARRRQQAEPPGQLMVFMDRHGVSLIVGELVLLALGTVGAITTDSWWTASDAKSAATTTSPDDGPL